MDTIITITAFILFGPVAGQYYMAVDGNFYVPGTRLKPAVHPWTGTTQFVQRRCARDRLQLTSQLEKKVILYLEPANLRNPSYLCIDIKKKDFMEVSVPFYPEADECIKRFKELTNKFGTLKSLKVITPDVKPVLCGLMKDGQASLCYFSKKQT